MPGTRQQIEDTLIKDLPWTITCHYCERDIDWEFDLDQVVDDIMVVINGKGVVEARKDGHSDHWNELELEERRLENGTFNMEG